MGKIKKVHKNNFNITGMDMWRDVNMRNQDRGLLGTMLSLPEDWNFSIKGLCAILPDGERAIRNTLCKLEELGYLKRTRIADEKGLIQDWEYSFSDSAIFKDEGALLVIQRNQKKERALKEMLSTNPVGCNAVVDNPVGCNAVVDNPVVDKGIQLSINELSINESSINQSIFPSGSTMGIKGLDKIQNDLMQGLNDQKLDYTALIHEKIDYEVYKERMLSDQKLRFSIDEYEEIVEILVDVVNHPRESIKISGTNFSWKTVQSAFLKLDYSHIEFVIDCLAQNTTNITNMKDYIISCLYNSRQTISNYYRNKVNHAMPWVAKKENTL